MTYKTIEAQAASVDFDALGFELKHAADYEKSQRPYIESNYEVDNLYLMIMNNERIRLGEWQERRSPESRKRSREKSA